MSFPFESDLGSIGAGLTLREREQLLLPTFSNSTNMMAVVRVEPGPSFRLVLHNPRYLELVRAAGSNVNAIDLNGKLLDELCREWLHYGPTATAGVISRFVEAEAADQSVRYDEVQETPRGRYYGESVLTPIRDSSGKCVLILYSSSDITDRMQAELKIRRLNRLYAVSSSINEAIVRVRDPKKLYEQACRVAVEQGLLRMAWVGLLEPNGHTLKPVARWGWDDGYTEEIAISLHAEIEEGGPSGRALRVGAYAVCNDVENDATFPARTEALARGYRSCGAFPLTVNDRVVGLMVIYADQPHYFDEEELRVLNALAENLSFAMESADKEGQRLSAEEALRESEARFRQVAENIDAVLWLRDSAKNQMLYVSPAYERIWGRTRESLYSDPRSWLEAIHPYDRERVREAMLTKQLRGNFDEVYRIVRPDGSVRWVRDQASLIRNDDGQSYRFVGAAQDITQNKQLEEQLLQSQKLEAIGQLAGGVAHDFNNLLTIIQGHAASWQNTEGMPEEMMESVREILVAAEQAGNLTRQLLTFSRKQVIQPRNVDLNEVVSSMTKMLRRVLGEDITLRVSCVRRLPLIHADTGMMEQVLLNLVVNARDAMPKGGELTVKTAVEIFETYHHDKNPEAQPGPHVCLTVRDTGCGIPPEHLSRIFEPFFTTKEPGRGCGLGLATVYGIVKQHHGWIEVRSQVGEHSEFRVFFPCLGGQAAAPAPKPKQPAIPGGTETILFVEDNDAVRDLTRAILERYGYRVIEAANGHRALEVWQKHKHEIDLLLSDIVMPEGMTGLELAERLAQDRDNLKIIFTSGYSADVVGQEFLINEEVNFLQKPFRPDKLLQAVRACLDAEGKA